MTEEFKVKLFSQQWEAFNCRNQFIATIAGSRGGKTILGSAWSADKIGNKNGNGLIVAPTYKILNQATLETFFNLFPVFRKFYKQQQGIIDLGNKKIFIRSADEPLGLEGMTLDWIWMDEAGMMNRLAWIVARGRVATTGGQILITTTPYTINWLFEDFYKVWQDKKDNDYAVFSWRSVDNPYFSKDFYDKEKIRLSPKEFSRRYEGKFTKMEGLVYDLPISQIISPKELNKVDMVIGGVDFGFRNPAAIAILKREDNAWYLIDEWYLTEKTTAEIGDAMARFKEIYKVNRWYCDPAEPDRIEELKRRGFYIGETNKNIKNGISTIQQLIRENRFFVFNSCRNTIDEFNSYHYDQEKNKEEPVKENDHLMDAIRYAIHSFSGQRIDADLARKQEIIFKQAEQNLIKSTR